MALFTKTDKLGSAITARAKLVALLADATTAADNHRKTAEGLAISGDFANLDAVEAKKRAAEDRGKTLTAAIAASDIQIAALQAEADAAADKKTRRVTATAVEQMAVDLEQFNAEFGVVMAKLESVTKVAGPVIYEVIGLAAFAANSKQQIPDAVVVITQQLRAHAAMVLDGTAPATIRAPDSTEIIEPEPRPLLDQIFTLNAVKYTDHNGALQHVGRGVDIEVPLACAERALRLGLACDVTDPRRAQRKGWGGHPERHWCVSLDVEPNTAGLMEPAESRVPAPGEMIETVGTPYKIHIAREA
jgi:hypothetical protein